MFGFIFDMVDAILSGAFTVGAYMLYLFITVAIPIYIVSVVFDSIIAKVKGYKS